MIQVAVVALDVPANSLLYQSVCEYSDMQAARSFRLLAATGDWTGGLAGWQEEEALAP